MKLLVVLVLVFAARTDGQTPSSTSDNPSPQPQQSENEKGSGSFIDPIQGNNVEYFDTETTRYGFYLQKVTWEEAAVLCSSQNGTLVEYVEASVALFIGEAMAESSVGSFALWIGGKFTPNAKEKENGEWKWQSGGASIDTAESETLFPMDKSPFWVEKPNVTLKDSRCLATARRFHHMPVIVSLPCNQKRSYICARPQEPTKDGKGSSTVAVGNKEFHLFIAEVTWNQALVACRNLGLQLAEVNLPAEYTQLSHRMLRTRPVMEMAWIGGKYIEQSWRWVNNNENIESATEAADGSTVTVPWYSDKKITDGCLLADRHICARFVFVQANCERRRNYICQKVVEKHEGGILVKIPPSQYWISIVQHEWTVAQLICKDCLEGKLIEFSTKSTKADYTKMLHEGMALTIEKTEIRHVWVGGYLYQDKFYWSDKVVDSESTGTPIVMEEFKMAIGNNSVDGFLEICDLNITAQPYLVKFKCLNLDREDEKHFFMYGLDCGFKQHFICEAKDANTTLKETCKETLTLLPKNSVQKRIMMPNMAPASGR